MADFPRKIHPLFYFIRAYLAVHGNPIRNMPKDISARVVSRQRPVSCSFCRKRKLRCSRTHPCTNCVSRSEHCDLQDGTNLAHNDTDAAPHAEILERLQRLEVLFGSAQTLAQLPPSSSAISKPSCPDTGPNRHHPNRLPSEIESLDSDVALLESIYLRDNNPSVRVWL